MKGVSLSGCGAAVTCQTLCGRKKEREKKRQEINEINLHQLTIQCVGVADLQHCGATPIDSYCHMCHAPHTEQIKKQNMLHKNHHNSISSDRKDCTCLCVRHASILINSATQVSWRLDFFHYCCLIAFPDGWSKTRSLLVSAALPALPALPAVRRTVFAAASCKSSIITHS